MSYQDTLYVSLRSDGRWVAYRQGYEYTFELKSKTPVVIDEPEDHNVFANAGDDSPTAIHQYSPNYRKPRF